MTNSRHGRVTFARLASISPDVLMAHMSDPRVAQHMPLLTSQWDRAAVAEFIATKEEFWRRDGLGHWAILCNGVYAGWGGLQRECGEWDYGLVLKPENFGLGPLITRAVLELAVADERIPFVTILLPPSRRNLGAPARLGARLVGEVESHGAAFLKYRVETI